MTNRYSTSEAFRKRALAIIPSGAQVFNKTADYFPLGISPYYAIKAEGSKIWDIDGNCYIDFINASGAVNLGYCDNQVTEAVKVQLMQGTLFSLSHPLEIELAEKIIQIVPCAEKVRFCKTGSDATSIAIRLARAYTKKNRVAIAGYHGWHDWCISESEYTAGIPELHQGLTHRFKYNDIDSLDGLLTKYSGEFSAIILEPYTDSGPNNAFLENVQALARKHGALLIFDEIVSGFRCALGGAQEYFKVTPDLTTLGKGLANGYPLSAIVGQSKIMDCIEEIFIGSTAFGETVSLAASLATLNKLISEPVIDTLKMRGNILINQLKNLIQKHKLEGYMRISGYAARSFIKISGTNAYLPFQIKTFLIQELFEQGMLCNGIHNISYAHSEKDIQELIDAYDIILSKLAYALSNQALEKILKCRPALPKFRIR